MSALPAHLRVAIVGPGFAGLGMAIRLRQEGEEDLPAAPSAAAGRFVAERYATRPAAAILD